MQLLLKPKAGAIVPVDVEPAAPIEAVKAKAREALGIGADEKCFLLFGGSHLEEGRTLADYHIQEGFTMHVHDNICGC